MIDEVITSTNTQEFPIAVDAQTNLCPSIQHYHPVHVCDIEIGADLQLLEKVPSSMPIRGNDPGTNVPLDEENNEMKLILKMKL